MTEQFFVVVSCLSFFTVMIKSIYPDRYENKSEILILAMEIYWILSASHIAGV